MFESTLHAGTEHPDLSLLVLSSLVSFAAGLGVGVYSGRLSSFVSGFGTEPTE